MKQRMNRVLRNERGRVDIIPKIVRERSIKKSNRVHINTTIIVSR